jgi:chemotaxis signal transduction protein
MDKINLGIPAEQTERIIPVTRVQGAICETENKEVFISLPALFQQKDPAAPHGVVLKSSVAGTSAGADKTVLLTPRIDVEMEIPEEHIHSLPEVLAGLFRNFRGAYCTGQNVVLILNPEKLLGSIL